MVCTYQTTDNLHQLIRYTLIDERKSTSKPSLNLSNVPVAPSARDVHEAPFSSSGIQGGGVAESFPPPICKFLYVDQYMISCPLTFLQTQITQFRRRKISTVSTGMHSHIPCACTLSSKQAIQEMYDSQE